MNADFFISADGNDKWSGRLPEPNSSRNDGPFASLARAQEAVRRLKRECARPITVLIRGGIYYLEKPFVLTPLDSGSTQAPITYAAYPGETPSLSGGRVLSDWRTTENGLWEMEIPEVQAGHLAFRQLFINGERRERSGFPSQGYLKVQGAPEKSSGWAANIQNDDKANPAGDLEKRAFKYKAGDISKDWKNIEDVEIVVLQYWMEARLRIQEIDTSLNNVCFTGSSWRPLTWSFGYYADTVFEGMVPGTWYLDRKTGRLYYQPMKGETLENVQPIVPIATQLMRFLGDAANGQYVTNIHKTHE